MSYCQGTLKSIDPNAGVTRNITGCSNRTLMASFDPSEDWPAEISYGPELKWPRVISDDFHTFQMTSRVMGVLYCIGVSAMGAALLVRVWTSLAPQAKQGVFEFGFLMVRIVHKHDLMMNLPCFNSTLCVCAVQPVVVRA